MGLRKHREASPEESMATRQIDLARPQDQMYLASVVGNSKASSNRAWQWAQEIGEVHYALGRGRKIAGYARLNAYKLNPDGTRGKIITGTALAARVAASLQSVYGGRRGFCERYMQLCQVSGDAYLIRLRDRPGGRITGYDWLSSDEVDTSAIQGSNGQNPRPLKAGEKVRRITLPGPDGMAAGLVQDIEGEDMLGRVWIPADRYVEQADSPMKALDTECEMLHLLTQSIKGRILSRFAMNGILYFPKQLNAVISAAPKGKPNEFHNDTILNQLLNAMTWAVTNPDDPKSRIPIMLTGDGDLGKMIQQIMVDAAIDATDMLLRAELIDRILMGLDVQPGQIKNSQETSHWQNWYQSDDERRVNVQPHLETMCWALNRLVLYPAMLADGRKPGEIMNTTIGYDLVDANIKTNLAEDSRQARDRGLLGDEASRRYSGMTEDDKPTEDEYVRMVGYKIGDPYLATFKLKAQDDIDWDKVATTKKDGPAADSPADEAPVGPGKGDPGSPNPADRKTDTPRKLRPA